MNKSLPKISIVMPCYNSEATIGKSIDSVLAQSFSEFELIIIDDSSSDKSVEIIDEYRLSDPRIVFLKNSKTNRGVSFARNIGIEKAKGRYLCFLDSDDFLTINSLALRVNALQKNESPIVFGPYLRMEIDGRFTEVKPPHVVDFNDMLRKNMIGNLTGMYDTWKVDKVFQKNIKHEDYLMWCELIKMGGRAESVEESFLGVYRISPYSLSGNKIKAALWHWRVLRKGLCIDLNKSFKFQIIYIFESLKDRVFRKMKK